MNGTRLRRLGWALLRIVVLVYLGSNLLAWLAFPRLAFPAWAASPPYAEAYAAVEQTLDLTASDGVEITAEWHETPGATRTLLFSHGNAEHLGQLRILVRRWQELGFHVLAYDYRGYGTSAGRPDEPGLYRDIEAAWHWLTETRGIAPREIILYGRSIGGGPSAWLAERVDCGGLVLESTFTSALRVPTRGRRLAFVDPFPVGKRLPHIDCPLLLVHGDADEIIHPLHARGNFAAAVEPKRLLWIAGAGHNDLHGHTGPEYNRALCELAGIEPATGGE